MTGVKPFNSQQTTWWFADGPAPFGSNAFRICYPATTWIRRGHRVGQGVHIGPSFKVRQHHQPELVKKRPAPSQALKQKPTVTNSIVRKESTMDTKKSYSNGLAAEGRLSSSQKFGPWILALVCSASTGSHLGSSALPYGSS